MRYCRTHHEAGPRASLAEPSPLTGPEARDGSARQAHGNALDPSKGRALDFLWVDFDAGISISIATLCD